MKNRIPKCETRTTNLRTPDYQALLEIKRIRGISSADILGCALAGWFLLSRDQQDDLIAQRMRMLVDRRTQESAVA